jgi:PAS domain S-box-containing protein
LIELGDRIGEAVVMLQDVDGRIGRYIFVSDQWAKITGYSKPELLQMTIFDLLAPGHRQAALERYKKRGSGTVMPDLFEVTIVNKNGKEVPLEITSASSVYMGESVHVAYIRDVTQRKNAEKLLKEANDLYLSTINHTGDIITRIDRDNRRTLANDAACEFYGKKREQLLGERIDKYIHPEDAVLMMEAVERMKREKKPLKGMLSRAVTPNGVRFVEYNWYPYFDDRGGFDGWQATGRDVTDRMHLEQQVKTIKSQVNALQETEKLRDELLCAITHELRLPLSVIKGYATTLLDPDVKWDEKQKRTFLEEINLNSDRLGRLIQDLLQMSFIDAGMLKPDLQRISCQDICDSAIHMVSKIAPNHNLLSNAGSELPDVAADKERIVEVISNLVENAVKFSQQGTNIEISADCIEGEVVFSVKDEGVGIPALLINRVFDRFFQARNASGSTKGGIGLGLPICRGIITAHGGRIWVESEEMKGSKFSFSLPVFDGKQAEEKIFQSGKLK